ncbi:hypothetical protein CEP51_006801 [Fusarium floridanum]|uniref:Response regulatory domain-containing protein n=1 Tax=Fusarium floridanum TaxID=1325733 RepID=A0A428RRE7_9HYPO|nr:hypothetical protein CEP51_006801 [Fusarium floridanum]
MAAEGITEAIRERETFKYDSILIANSVRNDIANPIPSSALRSCSDPALTALAQVAVLRLGASRALISLFDCQRQHIIAEATPTLSISASAESPTYDSERLWLCGTSIPRSSGVCEHVLTPQKSDSTSALSSTGRPPVTIIRDLSEHVVFREKSYCQSWPRNRFYSGVPIQSPRGINIGVFCIFDAKPRPGLDDASIHLMQDISNAILNHLELRRSGEGRRPAERMVRGLGSYVEGKATMSGWQGSFSHAFDTNPATEEGSLNSGQQDLQRRQDELAPGSMIDTSEPEKYRPLAESFLLASPTEAGTSASFGLLGDQSIPLVEQPRHVQLRRIFSKAANILRESIEVEGVLFLDASVASFAGLVGRRSLPRHSPAKRRPSSSSSSSNYSEFNANPVSSSNSDTTPATCSVLGFSTSISSSIDGQDPTARNQSLPEQHLQRWLRRYPNGKIFHFDHHGVLASSSRSGEEATPASAQGSTGHENDPSDYAKPSRRRGEVFSRKNEGKVIASLFPGARSVAFVPLWDSNKQRWCSGCFAYTMTPTRIFTVQGELSYLSAFGTVIMADVVMMDSSIVASASTSLLSSLSHELRSPLHGIVLCAELLRDTSLDVFQGDVLRSVEVCGRTLLDTINHLLDWSKINNFIQSPTEPPTHLARPPRRGVQSPQRNSMSDGMMYITSDLDVDMLVEEIVECVHAGHTYQEQSLFRFRHQESPANSDAHPHTRLDGIDAAENSGAFGSINNRSQLSSERVVVILDIDPTVEWTFRSQPGALRRIIMNLCGNSLKYTNRGFVKVAAYQEPPSQRGSRDRVIHIDIIDTGPGIGPDYLNHSLFKPFTQEDAHSAGAGLGLSLVRKFVRALGGSIHIQSLVGKGTRATVKLPLQVSSLEATETVAERDEFKAQVIELSRLRVAVLGFSPSYSGLDPGKWNLNEFDEQKSLEKICQDWLRMEVVALDERSEFLPDLILCDENHVGHLMKQPRNETSSPVIIVCHSVAAARKREKSHKSLQKLNGGLFSFISRPIGPRKLAKALVLSFRRWVKLQASAAEVSSISTILDRLPPPPEGDETPHEPSDHSSGAKRPRLEVTESNDEAHTPKPPARERPQDTRQPRFLLVEDNAINMRILQAFMKKLGHVYDAATDGRQAVDSYRDGGGRYRCILMDISMPVMDGFEATRLIRGFEKEKHLPRCHIFAISGLASKEAQEDAFATGLDLFLSKPVQLKELSRILKSHGIV